MEDDYKILLAVIILIPVCFLFLQTGYHLFGQTFANVFPFLGAPIFLSVTYPIHKTKWLQSAGKITFLVLVLFLIAVYGGGFLLSSFFLSVD